jgi:hypothetical protein
VESSSLGVELLLSKALANRLWSAHDAAQRFSATTFPVGAAVSSRPRLA